MSTSTSPVPRRSKLGPSRYKGRWPKLSGMSPEDLNEAEEIFKAAVEKTSSIIVAKERWRLALSLPRDAKVPPEVTEVALDVIRRLDRRRGIIVRAKLDEGLENSVALVNSVMEAGAKGKEALEALGVTPNKALDTALKLIHELTGGEYAKPVTPVGSKDPQVAQGP